MVDFFAENGAPTQIFTLDASAGGVIIGLEGTKITFPANAFQNANGALVTGSVSVSLREIYKKSDMILSNVTTIDGDGLALNSGGMFFLKVNQGVDELFMANGKNYTAEMPSTNPDPAMSAYVGMTDVARGLFWIEADSAWGGNSYNASLVVTASYYLWSSNYFGWANGDYVFGNGSYIKLTMNGTDDQMEYGTAAFLVFKNNGIIKPYPALNGFDYPFVPVDSAVTLVAVGLKDNVLYNAIVPITLGDSDQTMNFTLQPTTMDAFKTAIDALN